MVHSNKFSARLSKADVENLIAIADALRSSKRPFINRSEALKFALAVVAADATRFVPTLMAPEGHPWRGSDGATVVA